MIESVAPRPGLPTSGNTDPINGHEYTIDAADDLQYACIFELPTSIDCTDMQFIPQCDCETAGNDKPLCTGTNNQTQDKAKAYPGLRHLQVLRGIGTQGITASVCPKQLSDSNAADYGYRPSIKAIIDRLKTALGGQCLPRTLVPDEKGLTPCLILEARLDGGCGDCSAPPGRKPVDEAHLPAVEAAKADPIYQNVDTSKLCFCEIVQLEGDALATCQNDLNDNPGGVDGWCYIDATIAPPTGNPELVAECPSTEQRIIRFVGQAEAQPGATQFITCAGEQG